jgi:GTP-binding protein Era
MGKMQNGMEIKKTMITRSGLVALVGRPNVGKSTLINFILEATVAITSPKPQTTRHVIRGVAERGRTQFVFLDTPGVHVPKNRLGRGMVSAAAGAIEAADVTVLLIEASFKPYIDDLERIIVDRLIHAGSKAVLAINKIDASAKESILPLIALYSETGAFTAFVPISARTGDGVGILLNEIEKLLPEQGRLYDEEDYTDQTERMLASELIRRELVYQLREELPYGTAVDIERFEEFTDDEGKRRVRIEAAIVCERTGHKPILVGKGGEGIRRIGTRARGAISELLDAPTDLFLFVRVRENWRDRPDQLKSLGYDP